ncbi:MAG: leucyl/phenylalanyl-tRNA--protein transferase [Bacteroidetes bacterium]|nr:leucyl/phenylalanyl-tRNA--protein transferase [Bacteroidota bacterium]
MPVYSLSNELIFPDPRLADKSGLLAVGGDLSSRRLVLAYSNGIFPWYSEGDPILWWSPNPRMVLFPEKFKVSKSLNQVLRNKDFDVKFDTAFPEVIDHCSKVPRFGQGGTWITSEMKEAYIELHRLGYAHSAETYMNGKLVGGLYGVSLGKAFFGESMFYTERDASKIALYFLVKKLKGWEFHFLDAQVETGHLKRLGAENIPRKEFLELLKKAMQFPTQKNNW